MEDLISRQAAINVILHYTLNPPYYMNAWAKRLIMAIKKDLMDDIEELPAAERHGRWIDPEDLTCYKCSVCGEYATQEYGLTEPIFWHYCPNCGASMKGE